MIKIDDNVIQMLQIIMSWLSKIPSQSGYMFTYFELCKDSN
jgi:hypothetical protein